MECPLRYPDNRISMPGSLSRLARAPPQMGCGNILLPVTSAALTALLDAGKGRRETSAGDRPILYWRSIVSKRELGTWDWTLAAGHLSVSYCLHGLGIGSMKEGASTVLGGVGGQAGVLDRLAPLAVCAAGKAARDLHTEQDSLNGAQSAIACHCFYISSSLLDFCPCFLCACL